MALYRAAIERWEGAANTVLGTLCFNSSHGSSKRNRCKKRKPEGVVGPCQAARALLDYGQDKHHESIQYVFKAVT